MPVHDVIEGKRRFKDWVELTYNGTETIDFTSNGAAYTGIKFEGYYEDMPAIHSDWKMYYLQGEVATLVMSVGSEWVDEAYRTVDFDESTAISMALLDWINDNADLAINGKWRFIWDVNTSIIKDKAYQVQFTSNGQGFSEMSGNGGYSQYNSGDKLFYDRVMVVDYADAVWFYSYSGEDYQTVDFGETEQAVSEDFYAWFTANAEEVVEETAPTATFDLSALNLSAGTHRITVKARASGYADSPESEAVSYVVASAHLITFTIDGTTYCAESGMTWGEWCESEYNTNARIGVKSTGYIGWDAEYEGDAHASVYGFTEQDYIVANDPITADGEYVVEASHTGGSNH